MDNSEIAELFGRIADLLEFKEENQFRIRSYRFAAEVIAEFPKPLEKVVQAGGVEALQEIDGIGKGMSSKIVELLETGRLEYYEKLTQEIPASVLDLTEVPGIGLKTAQTLYQEFGVASLPMLRAFAEGGGLRLVRGLGEKSAPKVLAWLQDLPTADE